MKWLWLGYNITDPRNNIVMSALKKIQFLYNAKGKKTDVVIPLGQYEQIMEELEDLADLRAVEEAKSYKGKTFTLQEMKNRHLKKNV